jgi:hypothetical protein
MTFGDIPRNDVDAAVRWVEERLDAEADVGQDAAEALLRLQDDPDPLAAALADLYDRRARRGLAVPSFWQA